MPLPKRGGSGLERRLAAILSADMAGSSRLMVPRAKNQGPEFVIAPARMLWRTLLSGDNDLRAITETQRGARDHALDRLHDQPAKRGVVENGIEALLDVQEPRRHC